MSQTVTPRAGILRIQSHMVAARTGPPGAPVIDLSSNESALGASPQALAAARDAVHRIERYPEDGPAQLAHAIAEAFGLDPMRIVCGHGSDELLQRITRGYLQPGDEVIHSVHGYPKFPNYAFAVDATPVPAPDQDFKASVDGILSCVTPRTRMVLLANPDNPTGIHLGETDIRRLHAGLPGHVLLVLDSAYAEYVSASDYALPTDLVNHADNVVMTRTFSKVFGLAGMRLGWLYGPPAVVDILHRLGLTFPLSRPAIAAGIAAVRDDEHMRRVLAHNHEQRSRFSADMADLGLRVFPSETNFVMLDFDGRHITAAAACDFLAERGIAGRLFAQPDYRNMLRITIGLDAEMRQATAALRDCLRA